MNVYGPILSKKGKTTLTFHMPISLIFFSVLHLITCFLAINSLKMIWKHISLSLHWGKQKSFLDWKRILVKEYFISGSVGTIFICIFIFLIW